MATRLSDRSVCVTEPARLCLSLIHHHESSTLPGVRSPWRNNVDLSVSKNVRTGGATSLSVRFEVLNLFNQVQWAAPASTAFGNSSFGQITNQANNMRMVQATVRVGF